MVAAQSAWGGITNSGGAPAAIFSEKEPVLLEAARVDYDQEKAVAVASGQVAVSQGETILLADRLTYDQARNVVIAQGNVSMREPSGRVYFADKAELKDDLKTGAIDEFKARLADGSLFAARSARKIDENRIELYKAVYSPCRITCSDGTPKTPLWQLTADEAHIDQNAQRVTYRNAFMEFWGVPMLYSPYFSHPTPGADNKSGILTPEYAHSQDLGSIVKVPVYYAISQDKDLTLTPVLTSNEGLVMRGQYRQMFDRGLMQFDGSITQPRERDALGAPVSGRGYRGHIDGKGDFGLDNGLNWGFQVRRTTDDTYLRRYRLTDETLLTSRLYLEGFNFVDSADRTYAIAQGLAFQGLRADDNSDRIPVVLPLADFKYESDPGIYHSRFRLDGNLMSLYRDIGAQSRRLSLAGRWRLPYISDDGQMIEFSTGLRGDIYSVQDVMLSNGKRFDGVTGRLVPDVATLWHYPFINQFERFNVLVEPVAQATLSPGGGNPEKIPNEDSLVPEFTDTNLFSGNRFSGLDRIENGPRLSYGLRTQAQTLKGRNLNLFFGQHYRVNNDRAFPFTNDLNDHFSDYVGKIGVDYDPVSLSWRFRLDKNGWTPKRNEVDGSFNYYPLQLSLAYLSLVDDPILASKEELYTAGTLNLTREWQLTGLARHDLQIDQLTELGSGIMFKNECVGVTTLVRREYTRDRDVKPATSAMILVTFKNLE